MPGLPSVPSLPSMPSLPAVPVEVTQVSEFMVDHPVATFAGAVGAVLVIPKLVELFVRYLAGPVAVALLAFYVLENPVDAASIVTTVLDFVNDNPIVITIAIVGTAIAGLVPALLTATAATLLVYALLSVSFGTSVPEVQEMQGSFGETVENLQVLGKVAYRTVERLMQQSAEQQ
ncbi:hypothetical protein HXX76_012679 [Chlamydomonas incerta]|uniref:Uncharacterized protein n=1 Tax=Chlamydomonas incerta TaxID=51695 RepID=A0A835SGP2_CHLIN|nr:hypothetical protein HXX76_012679 [Chlamydomonas incerta]|eukprot:KAG2426892.1 hypothetical protein HXX76_012679 [Chlamydomonas incerta]